MKKIFCACLAVVFFSGGSVLLHAQTPAPDAGDMDARFFKQLKLQTKKSDPEIYQAMGLGYFEQGEFDRAFVQFNKAVEANPKLYWSWYYLGLLKMGAPEPYLKQAIQANPKFAPPYYWLGRYYCKAQRLEESVRVFKDYLRRAGNDIDEAERVKTAEYFILAIESGETDYETISRRASF